ncbi:MAG: DUF6359 domain-containing protein [Bacteroidales bacterium]
MSKIKNIFMLAMVALFAFTACNNLDDTDINPVEPPKEDGNGTLDKPYTVGQAIVKQGETDKWVSGYIVGCVNSVDNENVWAFEPPFVTESNILLAASPTETDKAKILPIQLVAGTDIRTFLNLPKNGIRLGQVIKIKGELAKYFGVSGLKAPTDLVAEGYDPTNPPSEGDKVEVCGNQTIVQAGFEFNFNSVADGQDFAENGWQNLMIAGGRRWQGKVYQGNGYVQATAHNATASQLQEMWLITPALNLDLATDKVATFETAQAYWKDDTKFEVYVLQCVDGKTIQTKVTPTALATSTTPQFEFVPGAVDLSTYTGKVFIGFRYVGMGGSSLSTTWCIDNFAFGVAPSTETVVNITSSAVTSVVAGSEYSYTIQTSVQNPKGNTTIAAQGYPSWITFKDNADGTATLTGTAPATEEASNITITAMNNGIAQEQAYTLTVTAPVAPGSNLIANGNFEDWTETMPVGWTFKAVTDVTYSKSTEIVQNSTNSVKVVSGAAAGTANITAGRVMLEPGDYVYSFYYYLDPAITVSNTFRPWGMIYDTEDATAQSKDPDFDAMKKAIQPSGYVDTSVKGQWVKNEIAFTVPKQCYVVFEVRAYKGTTGYIDNVSVMKK